MILPVITRAFPTVAPGHQSQNGRTRLLPCGQPAAQRTKRVQRGRRPS